MSCHCNLGLSARSIAYAGHTDHPHDPSDLQRCIDYCRKNGITTDRLRLRMAGRSPEWDALLPQWADLARLLATEVATRKDGTSREERMTTQLTLELAPLVVPEPAPSRRERWEAFAAANPHVEGILVEYARDLIDMGHNHLSMRMLWERLRFEYATQVRGDSTAVLNNNHAPFFAHALMEKYPDLSGVFAVRERRAEDE